MDDLFAPPGAPWRRVSPRLAVLRRLVLLSVLLPVAAVLGALAAVTAVPRGVVAVASVVLVLAGAWAWWVIGRGAARWGYAEGDEELYLTHGAVYRRLVVVPYGRMQYVDVRSGPLSRLNGIAELRLHTASPGTSAVLPGLPAAEAARLRDRLTALGESQAAGL